MNGPDSREMSSLDAPEVATAGWHPDPSGRHLLRWWDGQAWTPYAGDGTAVQWDPRPIEKPAEPEPSMPGVFIAFVGFGVGTAAGFATGWLVDSNSEERAGEIVLSSLALWLPLVAALVWVSRWRGTGSLRRDYRLQLRWSDFGIGLAGAIAGRMVSAFFVLPIPTPSRSLNDVDQARFGESIEGAGTWAALIFVTCVGAPLIEELFFRGLVQARLVTRYGPVVGISVASVLFGAAHLIAWQGVWTFAYAWAVAGGGLVLGTIFFLSKRLGPAIAAHAIFNAQAMLVFAFVN